MGTRTARKADHTLDMVALHIEQRDPRQLKPHPKNSRFHSEVQLKQLAASLRRFGVTKPILIVTTAQSSQGMRPRSPPSSAD
jgi:ParB-like chromosome segregation protein Spo0J